MRDTITLGRTALFAALAFAGAAAHAADLHPQLLTQPEFRALSEDLGAVVSFKPLIPAEPLGVTGFDIGLAVTATQLHNRDVWKKASGDSDFPSTLFLPSLRVHKGLPFDVDLGLSFAKAASTSVQVIGGELRWALLAGGMTTPAVAVRASVSSLSGVDDLSLRTAGLDISISKGFAFFTPYAGVGLVNVKSDPDSAGLASETFTKSKVFAGLNMNFGLTNVVLEADKTGDASSYGVKFGFRF